MYRSFSYVLAASEADIEAMDIEIDGVEHALNIWNRAELIKMKINSLFPRKAEDRLNLLRQGFDEVLPVTIANRSLTAVELKRLMIGATTINPDEFVDSFDWQITDQEKTWMRNLLRSLSQKGLHAFLKFATNLPRVPFGGFKTINPRPNVQRKHSGNEHFPSVYHCYNRIDIPKYFSEHEFRERLIRAVKDSNWGL